MRWSARGGGGYDDTHLRTLHRDTRPANYGAGGWPGVRVERQQVVHDVHELRAVRAARRLELAFYDLHDERRLVARAERVSQAEKFVEDASECPDIRLLTVRLVSAEFRRKVVRRSDGGGGELAASFQHGCGPEVNDAAVVVCADENVRALQVAVKHAAAVYVVQPARNLQEVPPHGTFAQPSPTLVSDSVQESSVRHVLHDDADGGWVC